MQKTGAPSRHAIKRETLLNHYFVLNNFSALHHKFHSLHLGEVLQRVPGNGDDIGIFTLLKRPDLILPSHHLRIHHGRSLESRYGGHAMSDQPLEVAPLCPMRIKIAVDSAAKHYFEPLCAIAARAFLSKMGTMLYF